MSEWDEREPDRPRDPTEGVRIIGPDEATEASPRGEARRRRSDRPRYRDRPVEPTTGDRPSLRFPLDASTDPDQFQRPPVVPVERHRPPTEVSHWAASAVEEVPNMSRRDPYEGDEAAAWSTFGGTGPRWRDDEPGQGGDQAAFDEYADPAPGRSVFGESAPPVEGPYEDAYADRAYDDTAYQDQGGYADQADYAEQGQGGYPPEPGYPEQGYPEQGYDDDAYDDSYEDDAYAEPGRSYVDTSAAPAATATRPRRRRSAGTPGDRDMRLAVGVGLGLAILALFMFQIGPVATMVLAIAVLGVASYEYFGATQRAGFDPLMPVGVTATVGAVLAAYNYGESALPLVMVLSVAVCLIWYLIDAGGEAPMANVGATLLGIAWIGLFGSFAGLLLAAPNGIALLAAAIVPTIGYDVGALFVGRSTGSHQLSEASPNKTVEGLVGGMVVAVVAGLLLAIVGPEPFDGIGEGLRIGLVAALAAPLGDLCESLIKRNLGIKDMGGLLPGHGGVLDRFDALLFVLPAVWYAARLSDFFLA